MRGWEIALARKAAAQTTLGSLKMGEIIVNVEERIVARKKM